MKNNFRILVATDYSKAGESAERYSIRLAKATNSVITFLHVYEKSLDYPKEFLTLEHLDSSPFEYESRKLEQHVEELYDLLKVTPSKDNYQSTVRHGKIGKEIRQEAKAMKADFIVLGTHDASVFRKVFGESHTWDIINKGDIPVLAIPTEGTFKGINNLVFATEYRESELPIIRSLTKLANLFDAELTVLHVTHTTFSPEFEKKMFTNFANEVKAKLKYDKLNLRLIHSDNLCKGLNDFCTKEKSSWLIMSPNKPSLFDKAFNSLWSNTKDMTFHTYTPLFTVPDYKNNDNMTFRKSLKKLYDIKAE